MKKILFLLAFLLSRQALAYEHLQVQMITDNIPGGAVAIVSVVIDAPPEKVWRSLNDFNHQGSLYPRIKKAFCLDEPAVTEWKNKGPKEDLGEAFEKRRCEPKNIRHPHGQWGAYLYQHINYPFPLSDRWIVSKVDNNELTNDHFIQKGKMALSNQKDLEVTYEIAPAKGASTKSQFNANIKSIPGGFVQSWMIELASKKVLPKFIEIIERESKK